MRVALCRSIKDYSGILARFVLYALSCMTTPRGKMKDPKLHRKQVTMPVFFVHCLGDSFGVQFESCLIALLDDGSFHSQRLLETELGRATLGQDPFDVSSISFINER